MFLWGDWNFAKYFSSEQKDLQELLKDFKDKQNDKTASFTKDEILEFYKEDDKATQCLKRLLGDAEHQPKLIIGGKN